MITASDAIAQLSRALGGGAAARLAASALIEADALGQPHFGIAMLEEWTPDATPGTGDPVPRAIAWRDCASSFAPVAVAAATLDLIRAARTFGVAIVFLRSVKGFGRLAPFVRHLADAGLVGLAGAEGPPFVAPYGGSRAVIGTNPLALAMGRGNGRVVIDVASSTTTMAAVRRARIEAMPLADGVAVDAEGRPTCIAAEAAALLPRGGQIGSLVGLIVELIAGVVGGGRSDPKGRGVFMLAFDPAAAEADFDWEAKLAALQSDWTAGGGHWPRAGGVSPEAMLDADFSTRLAAHLARLQG